MNKCIVFAIALLGILFCLQAVAETSLRIQHTNHQIRRADFWAEQLQRPIDQRIAPAPPALIEFIGIENQLYNLPDKPKPATLDAQFQTDLKMALAEVPAPVKALLTDKLAGIYLLEDLGGTGYTDYIYDNQRRPVGGFIALDVAVLQRKANQWASWKERTPFIENPDYRIEAQIEHSDENNRKQAIQYLLMHELAHVISVNAGVHPPWDKWDCGRQPLSNFPFTQVSWQLQPSTTNSCALISNYDAETLKRRADVVYYFGAKIPIEQSVEVYRNLEKTSFPTLYAATRPGDDFAEAFVSYVHTQLLGKPFQINIYHQEKLLHSFGSCWGKPRCAAKQKILEQMLKQE